MMASKVSEEKCSTFALANNITPILYKLNCYKIQRNRR